MYSTVLVPLDGSPLAERALPYAARLARAAHTRLVLLRVVPELDRSAHTEALQEHVRVRTEAEQYLDQIVARVATDPGTPRAETFVDEGEAAARIIAQAQRQRAGLIVMGTHGRSGLGRWLYGSVAESVLRGAELPIFMVPAVSSHTWPAGRPPRVMVTLDGSDFAREAVEPAAALAGAIGAELLLLRVLPPAVYPMNPYGLYYVPPVQELEPDVAEITRDLEQLAGPLRERNLTVAVRTAAGIPADAIAAAVHEEQVDIVAMATHGRTGWPRLVMGSVATGVLHKASTPLLLVRPQAIHGAAGREANGHAAAVHQLTATALIY
jgi:nucleotide-binding universal stress UspA family protein